MFKTIAKQLDNAFTMSTRSDGSEYCHLKNRDQDVPWFDPHAVHESLDDRSPDDWTYDAMSSIADELTQYDDVDEARESVSEFCDSLVEVYDTLLMQWASAHGGNRALIDEANEEFGVNSETTFVQMAMRGQFRALELIAHEMINQVEAEADAVEA